MKHKGISRNDMTHRPFQKAAYTKKKKKVQRHMLGVTSILSLFKMYMFYSFLFTTDLHSSHTCIIQRL